MRRREAITATGAAVAAALAGCLGDDTPGADGDEANERTVIVSESGEVDGDPDLAVLQFGVEATADTAREARDELARGAEELTEALYEYGIDEENVTTRRYRIRERIDRRAMEEDGVRPDDPEAEEEYVYYQGTHSFSVELEDIEAVGEVIDLAVEAGADEVGRVTYTLTDEKRAELREEALREALDDARTEAGVIADEVDADVVEATVVDASDGRVSPVRRDVSLDAAEPAGTPTPEAEPATAIEPGEVTVTAGVDVRYEIE